MQRSGLNLNATTCSGEFQTLLAEGSDEIYSCLRRDPYT